MTEAGKGYVVRDAETTGGKGGKVEAAGTDHEMISYPGAAHAFFWSGTPAFNQAARDDAWSRIIAMLAALYAGPGLHPFNPDPESPGMGRCWSQPARRAPVDTSHAVRYGWVLRYCLTL